MKYGIDDELYRGLSDRELKEALWALYERAYQEGKADAFDQPSELPYYGADVPSEWNDKAKGELMAHVGAHNLCLPGETAADYVQRMRAKAEADKDIDYLLDIRDPVYDDEYERCRCCRCSCCSPRDTSYDKC